LPVLSFPNRPQSAANPIVNMAVATRFACLLCLLLTACGQAGALYLPGEEPPRHGTSLRPDVRKPSEDPLAKRGKKADSTVGKPADAPVETDPTTPTPAPDVPDAPAAPTPTAPVAPVTP